MEIILEQVKDFANKAHGIQTRKYSTEPYILHPVRVMELCKKHSSNLPTLAAALLHDVLEDTDVTKKEMHHFLSSVMKQEEAEQTTKLVVELTDVYIKSKPTLEQKKT